MCNQLTIARTVSARASRVFDVWVSPSTLVAPVTAIAWEPEPGGSLRLSVGDRTLAGVVLGAETGRRLTYTWRWGGEAEETIIDVWFHAVGQATTIEIVHRGFLDEASSDTHRSGWISYLDGLESYL